MYVRARHSRSSVTPQECITSTQKLLLKSFTETSSHATVSPSTFTMESSDVSPSFTYFDSSVLPSTVVMTADKVLKVWTSGSTQNSSFLHIFGLTDHSLSLGVWTADLWLWCVQVSVPHHTHDGGGNLPLDGAGGHSEPTCVRDLRHLLLRCGESASLNIFIGIKQQDRCTNHYYWGFK